MTKTERMKEIIDNCNSQANQHARKYTQTDDAFHKAEYIKFQYCADVVQSILEHDDE